MEDVSSNQGKIVNNRSSRYQDISIADQQAILVKIGVWVGSFNHNFVSDRVYVAFAAPVFKS